MASEADFEAMGLLDGLQAGARQERVDLISWLLDRNFDIDHIRASTAAPLNLPASRVIGDDGTYLSAPDMRVEPHRCGVPAKDSLRYRPASHRRPRCADSAAGERRSGNPGADDARP